MQLNTKKMVEGVLLEWLLAVPQHTTQVEPLLLGHANLLALDELMTIQLKTQEKPLKDFMQLMRLDLKRDGMPADNWMDAVAGREFLRSSLLANPKTVDLDTLQQTSRTLFAVCRTYRVLGLGDQRDKMIEQTLLNLMKPSGSSPGP